MGAAARKSKCTCMGCNITFPSPDLLAKWECPYCHKEVHICPFGKCKRKHQEKCLTYARKAKANNAGKVATPKYEPECDPPSTTEKIDDSETSPDKEESEDLSEIRRSDDEIDRKYDAIMRSREFQSTLELNNTSSDEINRRYAAIIGSETPTRSTCPESDLDAIAHRLQKTVNISDRYLDSLQHKESKVETKKDSSDEAGKKHGCCWSLFNWWPWQ